MTFTPIRRRLCHVCAAGLMAIPVSGFAQTDAWPSRPVKWIAPYPAGGGLDAVTRMYANEIGPKLGQPLVVDNRTGAGGTIGAAFVAKSPADGYTVMTIDSNSYATANLLYRKLPYDSVKDIQLVATLVRLPIVIAVTPSSSAKTLGQLLEKMKAQPGKVTFATPGVGSPQHAGMELFQLRTATQVLHVPYKAMPNLLTDLSSGEVEVALSDYGSIKPFIDAGKVRVLAAATDARLPMLPDVPTFAEAGVPDYPMAIWHSLAVPSGTPAPVVARLAALAEQAGRSPQIRAQLAQIGAEAIVRTGPAATAFGRDQASMWKAVLQPLNLQLD